MTDETTSTPTIATIRELLGTDWKGVGKWIRDSAIRNPTETARRSAAAKRDRFYLGDTDGDLHQLINRAFKSTLNQDLRKDFTALSKYQNVTRRIVDEKATVYSEPARRRVTDSDEAYQRLLELLDLDAVMRELNRKLVLHEDVWVQYRVRVGDDGELEPVVDVVSPACFWAISTPIDPTRLVAIVLDQSPGPRADVNSPHYRVWTSAETFQLNGKSEVIESSIEANPIGRMPGVLATLRRPTSKGRLLACAPSSDIIAAHEGALFAGVSLLKETKSSTKVTYIAGDVAAMTVGQTSDSEQEVVLPEGALPTLHDRSMDLESFVRVAEHVVDSAASNHGLPPSVLRHRDASSGAEILLRRVPLRELRKQQIPVMRGVERTLAVVMSKVNALDLKSFAFDASGWSMDFGEVQQVMTEAEELATFETARRLGLTNTIDEIRRRNPDLRSDEEAAEVLALNARRELGRVLLMIQIAKLNGGATAPADTAPTTPQQNGASGRAALPDKT